ncbi:MAG: YitT family protein, partial [Clostridia bacterium]|nr:YitT family protein [Clostridia bacterium]
MNLLKCYTAISLGCLFYAVGFAFFLEPAHLSAGGVSGIALMITHYYQSLDGGTVIFLLNIPLLALGTAVSGKRFFFGTIWATAVSSGMISFCEHRLSSSSDFDPY